MKKKKVIKSIMFLMVFCMCSFANATLVSYWSCDDPVGSMTLIDTVGGVNASLNGSMSFVESGVGAEYGNALLDAHRNNYATLPADPWSLGKDDFTVSGWFKVPGLQARHGNVFTVGAWNTGGLEMTLLKDNNVDGIAQGNEGKLQFTVFGMGADNAYVLSNNLLVDSAWHWFAGVVSGQMMSLYVDGVLQSGSGVSYGAATTASTTGIGYIARNMVCYVDDIALFDNALSGTVSGNALTSGGLYNVWQSPVPEPTTLVFVSAGIFLGIFRKK